jgi:hypothetical protein
VEDPCVLLGVCGLYCGGCHHYRASFPEGRHLLERAAGQRQSPEGFGCRGCRSGALYSYPGCSQCAIRACAEDRGIVHCGLCSEFPCDRIRAFQSDGRIHHRDVLDHLVALRAMGPHRWLAEQAQRWTCMCGAGFSWYEVRCHRCGAPLPAYGSDPASPSRRGDPGLAVETTRPNPDEEVEDERQCSPGNLS